MLNNKVLIRRIRNILVLIIVLYIGYSWLAYGHERIVHAKENTVILKAKDFTVSFKKDTQLTYDILVGPNQFKNGYEVSIDPLNNIDKQATYSGDCISHLIRIDTKLYDDQSIKNINTLNGSKPMVTFGQNKFYDISPVTGKYKDYELIQGNIVSVISHSIVGCLDLKRTNTYQSEFEELISSYSTIRL